MRSRTLFFFAAIFVWAVSADAGTSVGKAFDAATIPAAFPGSHSADDATIIADIRRRLPTDMSVASHGHLVIAASGSTQDTNQQRQRIASYEAQMRQRSFPDLEPRRTIVILFENSSALDRFARTLYPELSVSGMPSSGFYHRQDRLILATTANGYGAVLGHLMLALLRDNNPRAPGWFEEAAGTLYESGDWRANKLTPVLNRRTEHIAPDEDLTYDVFAGICDCYPLSPEQLALMRLLLIYLDQRDELKALHAAIKEQGPYTTLLQALEAMDFDGTAWKRFAERSVRTYPR